MRRPRFLIIPSLVIVVAATGAFVVAYSSDDTAVPSIVPAPQTSDGGAETPRLPAAQPGDSKSLEIAPQPSENAPAPKIGELPRQHEPRQDDDIATLNKNWRPPDSRDSDGRVGYLGVELEATTECYFGMEEHGFEVVSVYPNSPAARAGLHGRTPSTPLGDFESLALFTIPMLRRSGALGMDGDLIVAVDDQRVRTEREILAALHRLRPGDTTYVTVIRPLVGGGHQTMRVAVHIDDEIAAPPPSN